MVLVKWLGQTCVVVVFGWECVWYLVVLGVGVCGRYVCGERVSTSNVLDGRGSKGGNGLVLAKGAVGEGTLVFVEVSEALSFGIIVWRDLEAIGSRIMCG